MASGLRSRDREARHARTNARCKVAGTQAGTPLDTDGRDESATQPRELTGLVADAGVVGKANASESRMNYDGSVSQPGRTLLVIFCVTSRFYGPASSHPSVSRVLLRHRPSNARPATQIRSYPPRESLAASCKVTVDTFRHAFADRNVEKK